MKKMFMLVALSTASLLSADQYNRNAQMQSAQSAQSYQDAPAGPQDEAIVNKIQDILSTNWSSKGRHNVSFEVANGKVTLTGTVEMPEDKSAIEQKVKTISGVTQVDNQITIGNSGNRPGVQSQK